ncbi:MAG: hypothetical protein V3W22_00030 [Thermoplasmata archaeon]
MGRKLRTGIRAASKVQEKDLVRKAKELRSRPEVLVPRCLPESCPRCPFDSLLQRLLRISQVAQEEAKLKRLARRGHPLAKAYAATLLLAVQDKAPYLAPAKTPFGTVHYAQRGKANREQLVGVQYFDVPELRLLTIGVMAKKRRLHVYSLKEEMVSSCREDRPPEEFVEESLGRTQISFHRRDDEYICPHGDQEPALVLEWRGAEVKVVLCHRCHPPKGNLPSFLGNRMIVPRLEDSFSLYLRAKVNCRDDECSFAEDRLLEGTNAGEYLSGKIGEEELLELEMDDAIKEIASSEGLFILGRECFEDDYHAFLQAMRLPADLLPAFEELKDDMSRGLVLREASTTKLLEALNRDQRLHLLRALLKDEEMAEALLEASETEGRSVDEVLAEALDIRKDMSVISSLPSWQHLPSAATLADSVARSYKIKGRDEASLIAARGLKGDTTEKVLALALLQALDSAAGKEWMFRDEERQLADFLTPMAKEILEAEGEAYREVLQRVLTASGSGEVLPER